MPRRRGSIVVGEQLGQHMCEIPSICGETHGNAFSDVLNKGQQEVEQELPVVRTKPSQLRRVG